MRLGERLAPRGLTRTASRHIPHDAKIPGRCAPAGDLQFTVSGREPRSGYWPGRMKEPRLICAKAPFPLSWACPNLLMVRVICPPPS